MNNRHPLVDKMFDICKSAAAEVMAPDTRKLPLGISVDVNGEKATSVDEVILLLRTLGMPDSEVKLFIDEIMRSKKG